MTVIGDYQASPLRPYVLTGGRSRPADARIGVDTLLRAVSTDAPLPIAAAPQLRALLGLCRSDALSVSEVAGHLGLRISVVRILVGDLIGTGHLETQGGGQSAPGVALLHEVLNGLRAL